MANYTAWSTGAVGTAAQETLIKESVQDLLSNLFPLDTPLQQILDKVPMSNVYTESPVDTFTAIDRSTAAVSATANAGGTGFLARVEGETYTTSTPQYPARLKSVAEIQGISFGVSDTDRAMAMYAVGDRYAYEALKTTQAVVNNFEHSFWWSSGSPPGGNDLDSTGSLRTARQTQGLVYWIMKTGLERNRIRGNGNPQNCTTVDNYADGNGNDFGDLGGSTTLPLSASGTWAYDANGLILDQAMFKEKIMTPWWTLTGRTAGAVGFIGPKGKALFSQFALTANGPINERTLDAASKKVVDTVDYYETDFGLISLNLCRYLSLGSFAPTMTLGSGSATLTADETFILMQPKYWKIGVVRGVTHSSLGKTGDFESGLIRGEQGLICTNPQGGTGCVNFIP